MIGIYRISKIIKSSVEVLFLFIGAFAYWRPILELNIAWSEVRW